ncbi:MAG: PEP-CTERM sorting domain-containing protein [Pirellulales bacterium]|nr:PEP-CTERM sorting domain-containing protein [Pirellulales bacterium]
MKYYAPFIVSSLFIVIAFGILCSTQAAPIIIDHTRTEITKLAEAEIVNAKSQLHIAYGHTSHGSQLTTGMTGLVSFANGGGKGMDFPADIFAWNNGGTGGALDLHDYAMGGDVGYYPQWVDNTHGYLGTVNPTTGRGNTNPDVNVIVWSWCGQLAGYTAQQTIDWYLDPMTSLESEYWGIKFVYMTCHLNGTGAGGNLNLRNEQIRQYCQDNNKILYDFADIESYDPDGLVNYMELYANDNCDYNSGSGSRNWATDWQNAHTQNVDWYNCTCAHSKPLNGNQKAYAAWALWTDLAIPIWNGPGGGNYNTASNWTNETVPNGVDAIAHFTGNIASPSTVNLASSVTLGTVKFDSPQSYTVAGAGDLTMETGGGEARINVFDGSHSIDVPVTLQSDTAISGSGSLTLSGGVSGEHALTVLGNLTAASIQVDTLSIGIGAAAGAAPVPEPSAFALLGTGVLGLLACLRRRNRKAV